MRSKLNLEVTYPPGEPILYPHGQICDLGRKDASNQRKPYKIVNHPQQGEQMRSKLTLEVTFPQGWPI